MIQHSQRFVDGFNGDSTKVENRVVLSLETPIVCRFLNDSVVETLCEDVSTLFQALSDRFFTGFDGFVVDELGQMGTDFTLRHDVLDGLDQVAFVGLGEK